MNHQAVNARVMPDGRLSLPAELLKRHGLDHGGDVVVQDIGDAIIVRTMSQLTAHVQALSRELLKGKPNASVDDFLADRRKDSWDE